MGDVVSADSMPTQYVCRLVGPTSRHKYCVGIESAVRLPKRSADVKHGLRYNPVSNSVAS